MTKQKPKPLGDRCSRVQGFVLYL